MTHRLSLVIMRSHISDSVACPGPDPTSCQCLSNTPCVLKCIGDEDCKSVDTLICQSSQPCTLRCEGEHACANSTLVPNGASSVSVECVGANACENTEIMYEPNTTFSLIINSECSSSIPVPSIDPTAEPTLAPLSTLPPSASSVTIAEGVVLDTSTSTTPSTSSPITNTSNTSMGLWVGVVVVVVAICIGIYFCLSKCIKKRIKQCKRCRKQRRKQQRRREFARARRDRDARSNPQSASAPRINLQSTSSRAQSASPPVALSAAHVSSSMPSHIPSQDQESDDEDMYAQNAGGEDRSHGLTRKDPTPISVSVHSSSSSPPRPLDAIGSAPGLQTAGQ